jgi:hypothetical protein
VDGQLRKGGDLKNVHLDAKTAAFDVAVCSKQTKMEIVDDRQRKR